MVVPFVRPPMGPVSRDARQIDMGRIRAWAGRAWIHIGTLLEKPNVPGVLPLTMTALGIVIAYVLFISFL